MSETGNNDDTAVTVVESPKIEVVDENYRKVEVDIQISDIQRQIIARLSMGEKPAKIREEIGVTTRDVAVCKTDAECKKYLNYVKRNHAERIMQYMWSKQKKYIDNLESLAGNVAVDGEVRIKTYFDLLALSGIGTGSKGVTNNILAPYIVAPGGQQQPAVTGQSVMDTAKSVDEIDAELNEVDTLLKEQDDGKTVMAEESVTTDTPSAETDSPA